MSYRSRVQHAGVYGAWGVVLAAGLACSASAQGIDQPVHTFAKVAPTDQVPVFVADAIDFAEVAAIEAAEASENKPMRFALANEVAINPANDGLWELIADGKYWVWRLRVTGENATSINFGFLGYQMPEGGRMLIYPTDGEPTVRPFTADDNKDHGQLWTPVVLGNDAMIEVLVPAESVALLGLDLGAVNTGYRGFGGADVTAAKSGSCNVDVVCPEGQGWENEIASVGAYTINGTNTCSGAMINNTQGRDYFLTADHCGVSTSNDQSMVIYWNYQNSTCRAPGSGASGGNGNGTRTQFNSGTIWRDDASGSDYTIVELEEPINPVYAVSKAGWDRSGAEATTAVAIHHPGVQEKRISFEYQSTTTTAYGSNTINPNGTHVRVIDWDLGTTEGGSSGSPLFDQNHRIIGQLHGGGAACGNNLSDWYGRVSVSWGAGLQQLLAPNDPGLVFMDTDGDFVPTGIRVTPSNNFDASGPVGGPFSGSSVVYTIENANQTDPVNYSVIIGSGWLNASSTSGTIPAGGTADVTVSLTAAANSLQAGSYNTTIAFANTTDGDGNTVRNASLDIGAFNYSGPSMPINDSTTTSRSLNVPDSFEIADVEVTFEASHTYVGDLIFRLSHNGTVVTLVDRPGTTGSGFGSSADIGGVYTFSDEGSVAWENLNDFPSGVYLPVQPLSAFDGGNAQGQWTLTVIDNAGSDIGEVSAWSIRLVPVPGQNCTGDIADDFGTVGADGQVSFGDFLALLGLIGPCPGGTPGCDGDFADDFGTVGADGQVSFGDFLALLGLIGPCP